MGFQLMVGGNWLSPFSGKWSGVCGVQWLLWGDPGIRREREVSCPFRGGSKAVACLEEDWFVWYYRVSSTKHGQVWATGSIHGDVWVDFFLSVHQKSLGERHTLFLCLGQVQVGITGDEGGGFKRVHRGSKTLESSERSTIGPAISRRMRRGMESKRGRRRHEKGMRSRG
jgi:hypothetical protein